MIYYKLYSFLKAKTNYTDDIISLDSKSEIRNFGFNSLSYKILTGNAIYYCEEHDGLFSSTIPERTKIETIDLNMNMPDINIQENRSFRYHIFKPKYIDKFKEVVLLLHGFNEKHWDKYLPWAKKIADDSGRLVVLFPIAFHMNRAPHLWSDPRKMFELSNHRKEIFPDIIDSTLSNVAISTRLHACPQRFLWSGLQTYYDVIQFVEDCKAGNHPLIEKDFKVDFFAYSIGGLLAEIIKLTNYNGYFEHSKLILFCGGAVFNRLSPVSKFIIDSEANLSMYSYLIEHLETHMQKDLKMRHLLSDMHPEGMAFRYMLIYSEMIHKREQSFEQIAHQVLAITLEKDKVIPPYEVVNTLRGTNRNIPIDVQILDFDYDYRHEDPFPQAEAISEQVDKAYHTVFSKVTDFLNK